MRFVLTFDSVCLRVSISDITNRSIFNQNPIRKSLNPISCLMLPDIFEIFKSCSTEYKNRGKRRVSNRILVGNYIKIDNNLFSDIHKYNVLLFSSVMVCR